MPIPWSSVPSPITWSQLFTHLILLPLIFFWPDCQGYALVFILPVYSIEFQMRENVGDISAIFLTEKY